MRVLKFGGTSVGSVAAIESLKLLLESRVNEEQLLVVVSAMGGVTNRLINAIGLG